MEPLHFHRGFTLVELMVVLAIMAVITSVVFTSQSSYNKTLILANTAYDVALSLRSAETYGLGGRAIGTSPTGYGIHFDKATPGTFILFADTFPAASVGSACHFPTNIAGGLDAQPGNCTYQSGQDALITNYTLGNGITISKMCAYAGSWSCTQGGGTLSKLDIVFARPNPDPFISANGGYVSASPVTQACLMLTSPQGGARFVAVAASGQIIANASSCP